MTNFLSIRPATPLDLSSIVSLDGLSNPHSWGESLIADALNSRENWVVEYAKEGVVSLVGWLTASITLDQSELELIVIDPIVRRQGLAKKLMVVWFFETEKKGVSEYLLEVRESNLGAIALYQSLGFELVGRRKNYYQTETGYEAACLYTLER